MTPDDLLALHREIVRIPSLSRQEDQLARFLFDWLLNKGIWCARVENSLIAKAGKGQRVLFNSHLDTVPANSSYTRDPYDVAPAGGKAYGLGSNDAKASVAAMLAALVWVQQQGGPVELTLMLVQEEETQCRGTEMLLPRALEGEPLLGAVVGEPTNLKVGIAQTGLLVVDLVAKGDACHAANSAGKVNPVWQIAEDIGRLKGLDLGPAHLGLGPTSLQPTMLKAAEAHNQVPGEARATLDVRTVPGLGHAETVRRIQAAVASEAIARSTRLEPYACPTDAKIVQAALRAGSRETFSSRTMSDQVWFRDVPAIKCGPGDTERSHTADEFVYQDQILEGAEFYKRLLREIAT